MADAATHSEAVRTDSGIQQHADQGNGHAKLARDTMECTVSGHDPAALDGLGGSLASSPLSDIHAERYSEPEKRMVKIAEARNQFQAVLLRVETASSRDVKIVVRPVIMLQAPMPGARKPATP